MKKITFTDDETWILREMLSRCIENEDSFVYMVDDDNHNQEFDEDLYTDTVALYGKLCDLR